MNVDERPEQPMAQLDLLSGEAARQLTICNACRYCEGYCAVFPALERRNLLSAGDLSHLANLCHDCRACFDACMYTTPHEFALNVPNVLSQVRADSYQHYVWPSHVPRLLRGRLGVFSSFILATAVLTAISLAYAGPSGMVQVPDGPRSPYALLPYPAILAVVLIPSMFSVTVMALAGWRYWHNNGDVPAGGWARAAWLAVGQSLTLRYLRGGGAECNYPEDDVASPIRRRLHGLVAYGFGLCVVSTVAAAVQQDFLGMMPPYPLLSVPVITGIAGGVGIAVGCAAMLWLKTRSSAVTSFAQMTIKDYGLLTGLEFLALSGLATFFTRDTAAFGPSLVIHLAAIVVSFGSAPYSKFVHLIFRFLALVRSNAEAIY